MRFAIKTRPEHTPWERIRDVWLAADEAWREGRLYRVALWGMRGAMAAALISLASWLFPIGCNHP